MIHKLASRLLALAAAPCLVVLLFGSFGTAHAQLPVTHSEGFDDLGTAAIATLPAHWRVDKSTSVRTVGVYADAGTATERLAGNSMGTTAANGVYNYGAGEAATASDRAVGWLSSGTATKSGNLYAWFQNDTGSNLTSVDISYQVEKYRNGTNAAGFSIQMYVSTDGATWTPAGPNVLTSFAADANNDGFAAAPGATASVSATTLAFSPPIPAGGDFYLAWNYSVTSGTTTSNAQGLGIDNFSIGNPQAITLANFSAVQQEDAILVTWETVSELGNLGFNLYRGLSPAGPDRQLNATLIPSQGPGSTSGFSYAWEDRAELVSGASYSYWLEDLDVSGATALHGPVSVDYVGPTAVTLSGVAVSPDLGALDQNLPGLDTLRYSTHGNSTHAAGGALPALWVVAGVGAALGLSRWRRRG
ncbi:MAG TPA: hypothetical protein VL334_07370 [Anaerolineae bacterium]|nr:hypothetical protein [Anaerolineae bacterium]